MRGVLVVGVLGACRFNFDLVTATGGDATGDGPRDGVAPCSGFICDGFEAATLDPVWSLDTISGTVTLDSSRAHRGTGSIHMHTDVITVSTMNPLALLHATQGFPTMGRLYARIWMYQPSPLLANPLDAIIDFSTLGGQGIQAGTRNGFFVNNDYTSAMYMQSATATVPLDNWVCLQLEIPSGTSGMSLVSVGGTAVADLLLTKGTIQPPPDQLFLGIEWIATVTSQPATDLWLDDIVISTSPTTCAE